MHEDEYTPEPNPKKIKLEIGKTYVQHHNTWQEKFWKIIHIDGNIAFAKQVKTDWLGTHDLFYADSGFRYNDPRVWAYRLQEVKEE
jgi:hypothetical protein